jgi:cell division protein FtsN
MPTLRQIFFALLLANVLFFAWRQNAGPAEGHEPQRLQQEIEPDKVKLILPEKPAPLPAPSKPAEDKPADSKASDSKAPEAPAKPAETPASPAKVEPAAKTESAPKVEASKVAEAAPALLCKSFSGLTPESAKAAQTAINNSSPNTKVALITSKDAISYWVHIPPQTNKAGAEKKVAELKQLGIDDTFIISDEGPARWAVSLGLFKSKEMADNYLLKLGKQGVRSAKIEVRDKGTEKVRIEVSAPAEALGVLAREIKPLANATLGDCKPAEVAKN